MGKSNEKVIQEYEKFMVVEIICKNGNKYRETRPNPKYEEKVKSINREYEKQKEKEGKKFTKKGYHKKGSEIHPKRKKKEV
jgi:hypothetical protein